MKLKDLIPLENPTQSRQWRDYLAYLLEYYPGKAWDLYQRGKLERYLTDKATQIVNYEQDLLKRMPRDQALEMAYEAFMPPNTDLPDQLPALDAQKQKISAWADKISSSPRTARRRRTF